MPKKKPAKPTKETAKKKAPKKTEPKQPEVISENTVLKLVLPWKEIEAEYQKVLKNSAKNVKATGFRKGHAPLKVAEEQLGRERLVNHALESILPDKYDALIKAENKRPVTQPEFKPVSMDWGKDWELEVHIAERPEVKLGDYKKFIKKGLSEAKKHLAEHEKAKKEGKEDHHHHESDRSVQLQHIYKELVEGINPQIPELLLKERTRSEIDRMAQELEKMGLSLDDYLARNKQTFEQMSSQVAAQTLASLQLEMVLEALEEELKIEVTDKQRQEELKKIEDEKVRERVEKDPQYTQYLDAQIKRKNLFDKLVEMK